jgi:hypothetical protein
VPYIKPEDRTKLFPTTAGELNYQITKLIQIYLHGKGESYQTYNDIFGALSCLSHELYRRKVAIYEDKKCKENGDVYNV